MTLKIVVLLLGATGVVGIALGYYLRLIISLGKKGSMELDLKQMELAAKDRAQAIVDEAEKKAEQTLREARTEAKIRAQVERCHPTK